MNGGYIRFSWGRQGKSFDGPWHLRHDRTEYLSVTGEWYHDRIKPASWAKDATGPLPWEQDFAYHYMLQDGEVQHVTATASRSRALHYRKLFGVRYARQTYERLDVNFSEEVGNRRGSWKGGTVGCSTRMLPGDTPFQALRRMQKDRSFDR